MPENNDEKFMRRCLDLACKAEGMTYPNPMVGSVIVHEGRIIGEGYHIKAGGPHAEARAIESVGNKELLKNSTLYVNLEPCSHFGKTPPCADMIISWKIPKVVVGTIDTSAKVSGRGIARLKEAGCDVVSGVCEEECRRLNRRFFTFNEKRRPYITLKWAESSDGFIDRERGEDYRIEPNWITGLSERILVHKWRASEQAILVGAGTIRADDPKLNVREWKGNNPVRVILSGSGSLPDDPAVNKSIGSIIIFTFYPEKIVLPGSVIMKLNHRESAAKQISDALYGWGIQSLFIEGGAQVLGHFIRTGLWDEARIFSGQEAFKTGVKAPSVNGKPFMEKSFSRSSLKILLNSE
jgi:diaminohydroxyphosphoribosylaminopyrimidine deaminase/5-amino-6-(5-phosphoribosylamino)uracil reductase